MTPIEHVAQNDDCGREGCENCGSVCAKCGKVMLLGAFFREGAKVVQTGPRSFTDAALYQITKAPWGETVRCSAKGGKNGH